MLGNPVPMTHGYVHGNTHGKDGSCDGYRKSGYFMKTGMHQAKKTEVVPPAGDIVAVAIGAGSFQRAISSGDPVSAIQVCKERAPAIARTLSEKSGWEVGRRSLKLRNPALNVTDAWEKQVLLKFSSRWWSPTARSVIDS